MLTLVVGGTGSLGRSVTRRLLERGESVRVMTRRPEAAADLAAAGAEVVAGDLLDRASLARACSGAQAVVAAAHSMFGRGRSASAFVDRQGHLDLVAAAGSAGVGRFLYTSVFDQGAPFRSVPFFAIKYEVEAALAASALEWTVLRPTAFMEVHAGALLGEPIRRGKPVVIVGRGERRRNFVAAADVAEIAVEALRRPQEVRRTIDVGGPTNPTTVEAVQLFERVIGRPARTRHLPLAPLRFAARLLAPIHPGVSQVLRAGIAGDEVDATFDAKPLEERFGFATTSLAAWVERWQSQR